MKSSHRYLMAVAVVAVVLITVLAAPTVARTTLAEAQARATGGSSSAFGDLGDDSAATLQDDGNETMTMTPTPTDTPTPTETATPADTPTPDGTATERRFEPYNDTPSVIPGRIEAEDYDTGGQGWAWFDRTPGNQGGAYREDDVDIETGGSGYAVAYVKSSEWLIYTVDIQEAGEYTATFRAASPWDDRQVWVWVDGVLEAKVIVPNTGDFGTYEDVTADVTLPAGNHYIRLQFYRDAQNLDYVKFESAAGPTVTPTLTPTPTSTQGGGGANVTPTPTETGNVTPTPTATGNVTVTPTPTQGGGGVNVTPTPTTTGNVTVTPTPTTNVTPTPTSGQGGGGANATDLTNQNSPGAAYVQDNLSYTRLDSDTADATVVNLQLVAENLTRPMMLVSPGDGSGRLFVVEQTGVVRSMVNGTMTDDTFLDVRDRMVPLNPFYDERGLLSMAFHPNFSTNGKVYAFYSAPLRSEAPEGWNCTNRLSEFTVANGSAQVDAATERILMEIDKPQFNHNGGMIQFGPRDGYLYVPLGDGGGANDEGLGHTPGIGNAQDLSKIYGKVLRIDVDSTTGPQWNATGTATWTSGAGTLYGIPADNPFVNDNSIPPEIFAYGFRNPAFAAFDEESNALIVANAGQELFESVQVVHKGGNYGWRLREGTHCFDPDNPRTPPASCAIIGQNGDPLIGPVFEGGHDIGAVVVGGRVYRGSAIPEFDGMYFFGYYSTNPATGNGTVLVATPPGGQIPAGTDREAASLTQAENAMWSTANVVVGSSPNGRLNEFLYGLGEDDAGELYALTSVAGGTNESVLTGRIWRVLPSTTTAFNLTPATIDKTIVEVAAGAEGRFSTLITAVTAANLTSTLAGPGPFTVFAPWNPAFEKLPPGTLDQLLQDPGGQLTDVLTYHVVPGRYTLSDLAAMQTLQTVSGETLTVTYTGGNRVEVNGAPILFPDVEASNGIIHVIDEVMIPPTGNATATPTATPTATATPTTTTTPGMNSSVDLTAQNLAFNLDTITVQAGALVTVEFTNNDAGQPHNFAVYTDASAATPIFQGATVTGPTTTTYTFTAPSTPGTYFFRCDVHPTTMTGTFIVT